MALIGMKFRLSWIVLSVAFVPLSVLANPVQQVEGHRCYWCGPLAEQVHRSQRAAKCNGDKSKVTVCDEDLPYCAIVASSPPYVESRYCVKFYQDECYPLYCNSTKIWKVICTCRGELCNGPNTQRENEVFEALHKLTQTKRHKRAMITHADFINMTPRKNKTEDVTTENINAPNEIESDNKENGNAANSITEADTKNDDTQVSVIEAMAEIETTPISSDTSKILPTDLTPNDLSKTTAAEATAAETTAAEATAAETTATETTAAESKVEKDTNNVDETVKHEDIQINEANTMSEMTNNSLETERSIQIDIPSVSIDSDDLKTEIIIMSTEVPKAVIDSKPNDKVTQITENIPSTQTTTPETKTTTIGTKELQETLTKTVKPSQTEEKEISKSKTNENMPTAVALQHTDTLTTKQPTEQIRSASTATLNMNTHIDLTTATTKPDNNTSIRIEPHILTIAIGVALFY